MSNQCVYAVYSAPCERYRLQSYGVVCTCLYMHMYVCNYTYRGYVCVCVCVCVHVLCACVPLEFCVWKEALVRSKRRFGLLQMIPNRCLILYPLQLTAWRQQRRRDIVKWLPFSKRRVGNDNGCPTHSRTACKMGTSRVSCSV